MRWSDNELNWARPLRSIVALFNNQVVNFSFFHLKASDSTLIEGINEDKVKKINSFKSYLNILKTQNIILDQDKRKNIIVKKMINICTNRKLKIDFISNSVMNFMFFPISYLATFFLNVDKILDYTCFFL